MTNANTFDLIKLYKNYFGNTPFSVQNTEDKSFTNEVEYNNIPENPHLKGKIHFSKTNQPFNKIGAYGQNIWHYVKFASKIKNSKGEWEVIILEIDICTIAVKQVTNIISTPLAGAEINPKTLEGKPLKPHNIGYVNEIVNIDDWIFTIRGFLVSKNRTVPETEIEKLKYFMQTNQPVEIHGGYVELFLPPSCIVKVTSIEFPEVQGGNYWIRPFSLECKTNWMKDLEV